MGERPAIIGSFYSLIKRWQQENLIRGELRAGEEQVAEEIRQYSKRFDDFAKQLDQPPFKGELNLGTEAESINWQAMPEGLKNCFEPEFGFQPEEITSFRLESDERVGSDEEANIKIKMERNGKRWSEVGVSFIAFRDESYYSTSVHGVCFAGVIRERAEGTREAMEELKSWPKAATSDEVLRLRREKELGIIDEVLTFAKAELQRQASVN